MNRGPFTTCLALALAACWLLPAPLSAQTRPRPVPYAVRNVRLARGADAPSVTLLLRDGRIEAVLEPGAEIPPGARELDGAGALALPAFVDAWSTTGCATPVPAIDQDLAPDYRADALAEMREANRKGIEPAFRASEVLSLSKDQRKSWREQGFGALLASPAGQLLAGTSALATLAEVAPRDALLVPEVFAHGAFRAEGAGYPSTPMGYMAQLRQFFLDARRGEELRRRWESGRPGLRPAWDGELEAALPLLAGERRLFAEAEGLGAIERWLRLADEHGLSLVIGGGRESWRCAAELAARGIPVVLSLDWGEEPKDPDKEKDKAKPPVEEGVEAMPPGEAPPPEEPTPPPPPEVEPAAPEPPAEQRPVPPGDKAPPVEPAPAGEKAPPVEPAPPGETAREGAETQEPVAAPDAAGATPAELPWDYTEPLALSRETRRLWEETRDAALRLHEAGVTFAFGTGRGKPGELVKRVRQLVEAGLPEDAALAALTERPAALLGAERHLGRIAPGLDASFALWPKPPFAKDSRPSWVFVDGFAFEMEKPKDADAGGPPPDKGVDASGTWTLEIESEGEPSAPGKLVLAMETGGETEGTYEFENRREGGTTMIEVSGRVSGRTLKLSGNTMRGETRIEYAIELEIQGDALEGSQTVKGPFGDRKRNASGSRAPGAERGGAGVARSGEEELR